MDIWHWFFTAFGSLLALVILYVVLAWLWTLKKRKSLQADILMMHLLEMQRQRDPRANILLINVYKQIVESLRPGDDPHFYASIQANLGRAYRELSVGDREVNLERAIECFLEALRFVIPEEASLQYASILNDLGITYRDLPTGDHEINLGGAIACFQEALRFVTPETATLYYAMTQSNLGNAYREVSAGDDEVNLGRAITCYQEALRFLTPETTPREYGGIQKNLGDAYRGLSDCEQSAGDREVDLERAITCYLEALRIVTPEDAPVEYTSAYASLGNAYRKQSAGDREVNLERAITCYLEALRIVTPEASPFEYARLQICLGTAYRDALSGDRKANLVLAITCCREALRFWTLEAAPYHYCRANFLLCDLYFAQGEWHSALDAYFATANAVEQLYRDALFFTSKLQKVAEYGTFYRHAAFAAVHCGRTTEALHILEQGKARLLTEASHWLVSRPMNVPDEVWNAFDESKSIPRILGSMMGTTPPDIEGDPTLPLPNSNYAGEALKDYEAFELVTRTGLAKLDAEIERVRVYAPSFLQAIDFPTALALLSDERTVLIDFCITEQGSIGFMMGQHYDQGIQVVEVPTFTRSELIRLLGEQDADGRAVSGWLGAYDRFRIEDTPATYDAWLEMITETLSELGQRLLAPILSTLPSVIERIILLPSADLSLLPLHAAPLSSNSLDRVCDRYLVSYGPSLETLAAIRLKTMQTMTPELYAVINPQEDLRLIFTTIEGAAIARLFALQKVDEGRDGTKQQVIDRLRGRTHIHFSCHGSYDKNNPLNAGLELADDRLTLTDLQFGKGADLSSARVVTLSACESAVIDISLAIGEEYLGISTGFMLSGVPCVVSSLWVVPDLSTALLMERFYQNHLRGKMDFAAALREAQVWVRELRVGDVAAYAEQCYRQSRQQEQPELFRLMRYYRSLAQRNPALCPFAHPYYWAAFTVNGM